MAVPSPQEITFCKTLMQIFPKSQTGWSHRSSQYENNSSVYPGVCIYLINAQTTLQVLQDHLDVSFLCIFFMCLNLIKIPRLSNLSFHFTWIV